MPAFVNHLGAFFSQHAVHIRSVRNQQTSINIDATKLTDDERHRIMQGESPEVVLTTTRGGLANP